MPITHMATNPRNTQRGALTPLDRKSTRLNSSHLVISYAVFCLKKYNSTPFGGNQLAILPDAARISTEGMQKIAPEFKFGETTVVLPNKDSVNYILVRIFTPLVA